MVRATSIIRNASNAGKPKPMSADHTLYHAMPTGFWKKFLNPEISSGLPIPTEHRYPQPGSRTERYATPSTNASDVAFNPYYKRDARRAYPQTSFITQSELSSLLLASPTLQSLPSPETANQVRPDSSAIAPSSDSSAQQQAVVTSSVPSLTSVLEKLPQGKAFTGSGIKTASSGGLPPSPPGAKWKPQRGDEIPHGEHAYFPMIGYK
ncbi:hypothetical protein I302_104422 [Kwoniella bestiolae CBS 10118]|uniref:Uncharacterized protein n=1 Tax=Kwoniella bestiolae CBS 10118 TaxID=1296100 RepID=A0A1B9GB78_9TREE|nr:hypothetical protein I302_03127 [Kwoniella bestiolae CBS 10118]OCF28272.1 hypothetical protein I302_03127 [Kwoniella bestiolae CBS 10118]